MRKICHITSKHTVYDTRIFHKECITLAAHYEVVLLVANARNEIKNGIEILGFSYRIGKTLRNYCYIFSLAIKQKAAIYHIHDAELLPLAMLLKLLGKKVIYDVHENYRESLLEHNYPATTRKIFEFFDRWVAKHCGLVLAERSYISLYNKYARAYCVVENFCVLGLFESFRVPNRTKCHRIIYIGTIHSHRGALVMLEVLYRLRKRGLDITLDMVGEITEESLQEKIARLSFYAEIENKVTWYGPLNLSDSYMISQHSFVGLCMLEDLPNHTESYPTKIFEYMAVGLPIVATNTALYRAVVERRECGICVPYSALDSIVDAIEKIYTDKELLQKFSSNGPIEVAKNYNWNSEKNILLDFYKKMLAS